MGVIEAAKKLALSVKPYSRWVRVARAGTLISVDAHRVQPVTDLQAEVNRLKRELAVACEERHPKKSHSVLCEAVPVKYAFIQQRINEASNIYRLSTFCRVLEVSRSGFYEWVERSTQPDPDALALEVAARAAHARGRECYGPKRLRTELVDMGFPRSLATVKRLRARLGLKCRHRRRFVRTTDSNHALAIAPNLLEQQFDQASAPNQIWVTDITYVPTDEGWLYVAAIKDLFTKKIVGWAMEDNMRTELVSKALWMAVKQERPKPGLIHHSDRGSQYASLEYRHALVQFGILASMSRRGNCYDNAPMESFWASLKKEQLHHKRYQTRAEARADIFDYIETFYNTILRRSALGNLSPMDFTQSFVNRLKKKLV